MRKRKPSGKHNTEVITLTRRVYTDITRKQVKKFWDLAVKFNLEQFPEDAPIIRTMKLDTFISDYLTDTEWEMCDVHEVDDFLDTMFEAYCDDVYAKAKKR